MSIAPERVSSPVIPEIKDDGYSPIHPYTDDPDVRDIDNVRKLLKMFAERNVLTLTMNVRNILNISDQLQNLHPLTFLQIVFSDPDLKYYLFVIYNDPLKRLGFINGSGFRPGFNYRLDCEAERGTLEPNIELFAAALRISAEGIRPLIQDRENRKWTDLYDYLFARTLA